MKYPETENPYTGTIINLYSDQVNELLSRGVSEIEILNLRRTPTYYNRENVFDDVILYNIMLNSDITTIKNLCISDKNADLICKNKHFWQEKLDKEGYSYTIDKTLKSYEHMLNIQKKANMLMTKRKISIDYPIDTNLHLIFPEFIENEIKKATKDINMDEIILQKMSAFIHKNVRFDWSLYDEDGNELDILSLYISKDIMVNILVKTLYYYPDINNQF